MLKLDAQVHIWYADRPSRPWSPAYRAFNRDRAAFLQHAGQTNSPTMALEEMAEAGVDGALLAALGVYGTDVEFEAEACARWPNKFRFVGVVDFAAHDVAERLSQLCTRGMVGLRIPEMRSEERIASGEFDKVLSAADDLALTLHLPAVNAALPLLAARYRRIFFYLNHMGTGLAPPIVGFRSVRPFERLPQIIELARHSNIGIKLTGAPALSLEEYPYRDIWAPILKVVEAYGADRVSWGSDYTRTAGLFSYRQGVDYLAEIGGLHETQLQLLYGGSLLQNTRWRHEGAAQA